MLEIQKTTGSNLLRIQGQFRENGSHGRRDNQIMGRDGISTLSVSVHSNALSTWPAWLRPSLNPPAEGAVQQPDKGSKRGAQGCSLLTIPTVRLHSPSVDQLRSRVFRRRRWYLPVYKNNTTQGLRRAWEGVIPDHLSLPSFPTFFPAAPRAFSAKDPVTIDPASLRLEIKLNAGATVTLNAGI